jgi:hypothetical protein
MLAAFGQDRLDPRLLAEGLVLADEFDFEPGPAGDRLGVGMETVPDGSSPPNSPETLVNTGFRGRRPRNVGM